MELFGCIQDRVDDPNTYFVFPSELTARFWCKRALHIRTRKSIPTNRFISWDQFKESCLIFPSRGQPVNRATRMLFLYQQLEQNRRSPYLRQIIPPRYAREPLVFLEPLQRLLPVLHRIPAIRSRWPHFSREKLEDLEVLLATYRTLLERSQLYEPNYEQPRFSPGNRNYILFFPELIEDYGEFADLLSKQVERVPVPAAIREGGSVQLFQTLPEEIRAAIRRITALLDAGIDPEEIILTVGTLKDLEELLRREAELFGLPLQFHLGKPLAQFPQVMMLHKAYRAAETLFSLDAMKAFLLCRSIPWKQGKLCRALIRLALDGRIVGNTASSDNWALSIESARRNRNPRGLPLSRASGFYSTLKDQLTRAAAAGTFSELKKCLVSFTAEFLDLNRLNGKEVRIFQFAIDTLDELDDGLAAIGGNTHVPQGSVFPIWWLYLGQRLYVPGRYSAGISVYPFRVSAGMEPEHHFVINASQAATSHRIRRYPFLKLHEEQSLHEVQKELSPAHLRLYSHSGRNVAFSYARRDFQRSNLPPPVFLTQGIPIVETGITDPPDAYELERRAWIDGTPFPLQEFQKTGYAAATSGALGIKGIDAAKRILQDGRLIQALQERLRDDQGRFRISATALEHFSRCPFQFLLERLLDLRGEEYDPTMVDAMELGVLLHRGMELFFTWVQSDDSDPSGMLSAGRRQEYRRHLESVVSRIFSDYGRRKPTLLVPVEREIRRRVEELILAFLDVELEMMVEERVEGIEVPLEAQLPEIDTILVGTIDRLSRNPGGYTLIDYKKKRVPTRGDLFSEQPLSLQMPFYIHLMEQNDRSVTRAAYYSFESKRYHFLFGGPKANMAGPGDIRRSIDEVKRRIVDMRERIAAGDFRIGTSRTTDCGRCALQEICRGGYSLDG